MVYYTIPEISTKKFYSLAEAELACNKIYNPKSSYTIEEHTVNNINYTPNNETNNQTEEIKLIIENLRKYYNDEKLSPFYDNFIFSNIIENSFIDYINLHYDIDASSIIFKNVLTEKYDIVVRQYLNDLFNKYPDEKIKVCKIISNCKLSNAICLVFNDANEYVNSGYDNIEFPKNIIIQLKGDNKKHPSIIKSHFPKAYDENAKTKYLEKVDLSDEETKEYIQNIFNLLIL